jgi:hypothetical protein
MFYTTIFLLWQLRQWKKVDAVSGLWPLVAGVSQAEFPGANLTALVPRSEGTDQRILILAKGKANP